MLTASILLRALPGILALAGFGQAVEGMVLARQFRREAQTHGDSPRPPVTILKPLLGDEALLEQALSSFCKLDWPQLQILCGVADPGDPAIEVVQRVQRAFPNVRLDLVQNPRVLGHNRKISNLINMLPSAAHEILVISDSDMHVAPDYLHRVTASLAQPGVGLVTSLYVGRLPKVNIITELAAAHIAQIFAPGALLARKLGRQDCLGATMALSKTVLARAGGFERLLPFVADDAWLGKFVSDLGLSVRLCSAIPATTIGETDFAALWQHELRWARTVRSVEPIGFAASILQFPLLFCAIHALMLHHHVRGVAFFLAAWLMRAMIGRATENFLGAPPTKLYLAPVREALSVAVWCAAHFGHSVAWRGQVLTTMVNSHDFSLARATLKGPQT